MTPNRPRLPSRAKYQPFLSSKGNDAELTLEKPKTESKLHLDLVESSEAIQPYEISRHRCLVTLFSTSLLAQSSPRNAAWYQRNAKIFAKLTQIVQPGERALVVFGSGHAFWLRHFVQNTPGFQLIEPGDYLR